MTKEQRFYKALEEVFIGAKLEGEGGFINLMRIKSNYYHKINELLKNDIENALKQYPKFRDELFDKLHSFFARYFTESGSIYFNSTPFHNNVYEKVYTDEKDVILFWKTQMLYYVKTDRIFRSLPIEFDGLMFYFDAAKVETKKANERRTLVFNLDRVKEDGTIIFGVQYSEKGRKTKQDDILRTLKKKGIAIAEEQLERAFRIFEKQSEVDFFINKNAKAFLQEQFKLWSYQYFWEGAKEWGSDRVNQLQILKDIAFKIIDFISQFENELVKIWNKPKFVKNSNYVITFDKISDNELIEKIKKHKNYSQQVKEWKELGIDKDNPKAPIDTKYFKDLELEILNLFDHLDQSLDGWLIKSENYQALNTVLPKFRGKIQTIYIDPPFNLDSSDQFIYRTNYKDANWATLLENRLRIAKDWLNPKGCIFVRCDYHGNWIVKMIMDDIFDIVNFRNEIAIGRTLQGALNTQFKGTTTMNTGYDNIYWYSLYPEVRFKNFVKPAGDKGTSYWHVFHKPTDRKNLRYELFGITPTKGQWLWNRKRASQAVQNYKDYLIETQKSSINLDEYWRKTGENKEFLRKEGSSPGYSSVKYWIPPRETVLLNTNWTDIPGYSSLFGFQTENSEALLKRVIENASDLDKLIMDFFLGSGTTTAVAHKLGRKWFGVEMGEHFYTVILPRMKKVLAYDKRGISKDSKEYQGGGFFKYYELEQYEEALAKCKYEDGDLFTVPDRSPYQEYVFMKDEKLLGALEIDYEKDNVIVDLSKLYSNIDIVETLSNLTGQWIKKINAKEVEFEDGIKMDIKNLDYKLIKPLVWW